MRHACARRYQHDFVGNTSPIAKAVARDPLARLID
jgi:hypothetical protein